MGEKAARTLTARRSRARAYLLLARVSNLPTVLTNVLAGTIASGAAFVKVDVARVSVAIALMYSAGMFLNDAFDREFDARIRPDRPIPSGDVVVAEVFIAGWTLLVVGLLFVAQQREVKAVAWALLLAGCIVFYNYWHKQNPFGPAVMGICRGLVYCVAAAASSTVTPWVAVCASVLTLYVIGLTWVAKRVGPAAGWLIPILIAGISIVDAAVIAASGGGLLIWIALAGFPATLLMQRVVPGT